MIWGGACKMNNQGILLGLIGLFLCGGILQLVLYRKRKKQNEGIDAMERQIHGEDDLYKSMVNVNRSYKHIRHDIKKQERILQFIKRNENIIGFTGNRVLDSVLTLECEYAKTSDLNLQIQYEKKQDNLPLNFTDSEIISLFANLLDNAREACERCENRLQNEIVMELTVRNQDLHVVLTNRKPEKEKLETNNLKTSKENKNDHGYGVEIIKNIVKRKNGIIVMKDLGDWFQTEITLPGICTKDKTEK